MESSLMKLGRRNLAKSKIHALFKEEIEQSKKESAKLKERIEKLKAFKSNDN